CSTPRRTSWCRRPGWRSSRACRSSSPCWPSTCSVTACATRSILATTTDGRRSLPACPASATARRAHVDRRLLARGLDRGRVTPKHVRGDRGSRDEETEPDSVRRLEPDDLLQRAERDVDDPSNAPR